MDQVFKNWLKTIKEQIKNDFSDIDQLLHEAYILGRNTRRTTRVKKEAHPAYASCIEFWLKEYHKDWVGFNAGEGKAMNDLIVKMEKYYHNFNERISTTEDTINFFKHLCMKLPEFYKSKNLKIINQHFDGIIEEIRTKRKPGSNKPSAYDIIHSL